MFENRVLANEKGVGDKYFLCVIMKSQYSYVQGFVAGDIEEVLLSTR